MILLRIFGQYSRLGMDKSGIAVAISQSLHPQAGRAPNSAVQRTSGARQARELEECGEEIRNNSERTNTLYRVLER